MSNCFLKRMLPFLLTLVVGVMLGSLFQREQPRPRYTSRVSVEYFHFSDSGQDGTAESHRIFVPRDDDAEVTTPLTILFEPPTHMTAAALRHQTYGVVQLLVEYGADGRARVLERIHTLPDGLTEEAERVAERAQFRPEARGGQPVSVTRLQSYYFDMGRY